MSVQTLLEKLQIKDEKNLLIQGLPSSIEKQFIKLIICKKCNSFIKIQKDRFCTCICD